MQLSMIYGVIFIAFAAMVACFYALPEAVVINLFSGLVAAVLGYRAFTRTALLLCAINVLAMMFFPLMDASGWLSLKGAAVFVACVMFFGIAFGCEKTASSKRFYY